MGVLVIASFTKQSSAAFINGRLVHLMSYHDLKFISDFAQSDNLFDILIFKKYAKLQRMGLTYMHLTKIIEVYCI